MNLSYDNFSSKTLVLRLETNEPGVYSGVIPVPVSPVGPAILQVVHRGYYSCADIEITAAAAIEPQLDPPAIDFGQVNGGVTDVAVLALSNVADLALEISSISIDGQGFALAPASVCDLSASFELRSAEACALPIQFAADTPGFYQGLLSVELGSGQVIEAPLTATSVAPGTAFSFGQAMSASFYDPLHQGEGFLIEVLPDGIVLIYWFTYDEAGEQRWFVGVGEADADGFYVAELYQSEGGIFGPDFNPDAVQYQLVGSLWISFDSCGFGAASYLVDGRFGSQQIQRLTQLSGLTCE